MGLYEMNKRTKTLQFSTKARKEIYARDGARCLFCDANYRMCESRFGGIMDCHIYETMHIVSRAHGGLGIAQNGVIGCKYHHRMLDGGSKAVRTEMQWMIDGYMKTKYPGWSREKLVYRKEWKSGDS